MTLAELSPTEAAATNDFEGQGFRVMAVAAGPPAAMKLTGLIALNDPPRMDSAALVTDCGDWAYDILAQYCRLFHKL